MRLEADEGAVKTGGKIRIVAGVVFNEAGRVLIVKRRQGEIGKDGSILHWTFPTGKQLEEELMEECIAREILEETGYLVHPLGQIAHRLHPQFNVDISYFFCWLLHRKQVQPPQEPEEIADIKWVKPTELRRYFTTSLDPNVAKFLGLKVLKGVKVNRPEACLLGC